RALLHDGRLPEACDRFERSQRIEPKVGTALNLGDCRERQGRIALAWEAFIAARSLASRDHDDREGLAAQRATSLEPRLAHLTIVTRAPVDGLAVTRDGDAVSPAAIGTAIPVDPGRHEIAATAPGYRPWSTTVALAPGATEAAIIPELAIDPDA